MAAERMLEELVERLAAFLAVKAETLFPVSEQSHCLAAVEADKTVEIVKAAGLRGWRLEASWEAEKQQE